MKTKNIALISVIVGLFLIGLVAANVFDVGTSVPGGTEKYKVTCSGVVEVDAFGVGDPSLDPAPSCNVKQCSGFGLSFAQLAFLGSEGEVKLVVDGEVVATKGYSESFGNNADFSVTSACIPRPDSVTVELYEQGTRKDTWTGGFQ